MNRSLIIKKSEMNTSKWFGGTTTQLFIFPEKSSLKKLDFDFRLSTATIEVDSSKFTPLPGVHRELLLLDGELKLEHKKHHSIDILLNNIDEFEGDWETTSFGKAIDLNLMSRKKYKSLISVFKLTKNSKISDRNLNDFSFLYLYKGSIKSNYGEMSDGDILVIKTDELYKFMANEISTVVHISLALLY